MNPASIQPVESVTATLIASPIPQEFDASTVNELALRQSVYTSATNIEYSAPAD